MDGFFHNIVNRRYENSGNSRAFEISGSSFTEHYYLADGIYPPWSIFAKPISIPVTCSEKLYTERQSSARKDVERFFGVLKQRFKIVRTGNRIEFRDKRVLCDIVRVCVIIHNIIIRNSASESFFTSDSGPESDTCESKVLPSDDYLGMPGAAGIEDSNTPYSENNRECVSDAIHRLKLANGEITSVTEHERLRRALLRVFDTCV